MQTRAAFAARMLRRALALFVALCCLLPCFFAALAAEGPSPAPDGPSAETEAVSLARDCSYALSVRGARISELYDLNARTNVRMSRDASVSVTFSPELGAASLFLSFFTVPSDYTLRQFDAAGRLLREEAPDPALLTLYLPLEENAARVELSAPGGFRLSDCVVYGPGALPSFLHDWSPTPDKLDYLVVSAHPDDDQLFLGAVAPICGGRDGLTGTTLFMTCKTRVRYTEALNGCWTAGIRCMPLFLWFTDGRPDEEDTWYFWDYDEVVASLVRALRRVRPEVVVTHDFDGEYGQPLHKATAKAVAAAVPLAADPAFDPDSAAEYGVWQVKKLYIHLYQENRLTLDMREPIAAFDGLNALEVARLGWRQHVTEYNRLWFEVEDSGRWSAAEYGLYASTVGADTGKNDLFEHIPAESLTTYVPPTPSPAPSPTPSPVPSPTPAETPAARPAQSSSAPVGTLWWKLAAITVVLAGIALVLIRLRKTRR